MTSTETEGQHRAPEQSLLARLAQLPSIVNLAEPVRVRLYGITSALVALLVGYGLMDARTSLLWLALAAASLGFGTTELVRSAVVSPATAQRVAIDAASSSAATDLEAARWALYVNGVAQRST